MDGPKRRRNFGRGEDAAGLVGVGESHDTGSRPAFGRREQRLVCELGPDLNGIDDQVTQFDPVRAIVVDLHPFANDRIALVDFIDQVEAQRGKKLTDEEADALIARAKEIINNL